MEPWKRSLVGYQNAMWKLHNEEGYSQAAENSAAVFKKEVLRTAPWGYKLIYKVCGVPLRRTLFDIETAFAIVGIVIGIGGLFFFGWHYLKGLLYVQ